MTFSVLDLLGVSWLFMQVGLCPKNVLMSLIIGVGVTQRKEAWYMENKQSSNNEQDSLTKRYIAHGFLSESPVLIDRAKNTMTFYRTNLYGQIYNLNTPEHYKISNSIINGFIRRTQNLSYNTFSGKAIDPYIYKYIMTLEQQAKCRYKPSIPNWDKFIIATDDKAEAIKAACEFAFENVHTNMVDKVADRDKLLKYCDDFLSGKAPQKSELATKPTPPATEHNTSDHGDR